MTALTRRFGLVPMPAKTRRLAAEDSLLRWADPLAPREAWWTPSDDLSATLYSRSNGGGECLLLKVEGGELLFMSVSIN
ncbi:MAG: hypothetical protein AB7N76_02675 [Planctomycetota bacterium]